MGIDKNINILVVDDFSATCRTMKKILGQLGYKNVEQAHNGEQALEKIKTKKFGLIISDWYMEPVNGMQLLKELRQPEEDNDHVPFMMVTAETSAKKIQKVTEAKADAYIVKPFKSKTFKNKIVKLLAGE